MYGLSGARAGARGPGERGQMESVSEVVDLPEGRRADMNGWGKGALSKVSGRVEVNGQRRTEASRARAGKVRSGAVLLSRLSKYGSGI